MKEIHLDVKCTKLMCIENKDSEIQSNKNNWRRYGESILATCIEIKTGQKISLTKATQTIRL